MLMRTPTRIEFKAEDAQEYINKAREKKKPRSAVSGPPPIVSPSGDVSDTFGTDVSVVTSSANQGASDIHISVPSVELPSDDSFERVAAGGRRGFPPGRAAQSPQRQSPPQDTSFQAEVEQLMVLGFDEQEARRALTATGGDLEAAADRLLL
mmetsp:Transcript_20366/g.36413  ORF Transcript_20366/g.36413 Transcript_20366/m.36413 type:complete len:152 (+) Transcript_20366:33-488(+)